MPREALRGGRYLRTALLLVALGVLVIGLLWSFQRRLIYLPDPGPLPPAAQILPGARDVTLHTADGLELGAWHVPADAGRATVLVANGNAGSRALRAPLAAALAARGFGVLLFDYRGYAGNPGFPTEEGLALDVRAARSFLVERAAVPPGHLVLLGESLGAAVVAELATAHPPAGLVLRSPFTALADVAAVHYPYLPVRALLRDRFPVARHVAAMTVPTVVVLGSDDGIVPPEQSRAVARAAAGPVRVVEVKGADHNDRALLDGPELLDAVDAVAAGTSGGDPGGDPGE